MKKGAKKIKGLFKKRYLEIIVIILVAIASVILFFSLSNVYNFLIVEAVLVIAIPIIIRLNRKTADRKTRNEIDALLRVGREHQIPRSVHIDTARYSSPGYIDKGAGAEYGRPVGIMISSAEVMYDDEVRKKKFFGKKGRTVSQYYPLDGASPIYQFMMTSSRVKDSFDKGPSLHEVFDEKSLQFLENIRKDIVDMGGKNIKLYYDEVKPSLVFMFSKSSKYSFITGIILHIYSDKEMILEGILKKYQHFSLTLHKNEVGEENKYSIISSYSVVKEGILAKDEFKQKLETVYENVEHLMINQKYVTGNISNIKDLKAFLGLVKELSLELSRLDIGIIEVEELECLNCGEKISLNDAECSSCGTSRPRCKVCRLELYPSEKEDIVQTPCCGVYAHKLHMIMWLDNHRKCPNCQKLQTRWLDQLKESY
ncbi:MAG: E3 ubiquitin protein ligase [Candidatus Heimdallarchaeota archaeon]|nr:E3 ubiquitin protein ligase [Candidatus Heimdallarchaeota archaeon]